MNSDLDLDDDFILDLDECQNIKYQIWKKQKSKNMNLWIASYRYAKWISFQE